MARVLVTGMSGTGKTTVLDELRRRGHMTVDTDYDGWELPSGAWDEQRMHQLLASSRDVVVSGTVENQGHFYDRFEHVVLLSAPLQVLVERASRRSNNPMAIPLSNGQRSRNKRTPSNLCAEGRPSNSTDNALHPNSPMSSMILSIECPD